MENQYCKVGTVTPISAANDVATLLEYQYQNFLKKATSKESNTRLLEFFDSKAQKIKRALESWV